MAALTVVWAGPHVTQLLAEWGADVIRIEPITYIQPNTRNAELVHSPEQARAIAERGITFASYPNLEAGEDYWNRFPAFNSHARNKRSMTADVMTPEGREAFLRLIERSDVFVENNVPRTIDRAGIGWEQLREVNPRLIMLRMPAYGLTGPYRDYRAFGLQTEGMIGHQYIRGYPDATPELNGDALTADGINGVQGALAVAMALLHRERTGVGQLIELPLAEGFIPALGEFLLDYAMNGVSPPPQGNRHRHHAPHNVYPCRGDDAWIAIDVATDAEFVALCAELGADQLTADARFASAEARLNHRAELDAELAARTSEREKEQLFHALQARGVIAAPVHDELEALADAQLAARDWFREIAVDGLGTHRYPGYLFKLARTPSEIRRPPCKLGEHNREIYLDLLGYTREEYDALVARGLVGTRYAPDLLPRRR